MDQPVQKGNICSGPEIQPYIGFPDKLDFARISHDHLGTPSESLVHMQRYDRMTFRCVGAEYKENVGARYLVKGIACCPCSQRGGQPGHRWSVSDPCAVIDIVAAERPRGPIWT